MIQMPSHFSSAVLFLISLRASNDPVVVALAGDREEAKRAARPILGHNPDHYIVQPLTVPGAVVHVSVPEDAKVVDHRPTPAEPRFSEATIKRWKAYEAHRIRTEFTNNMCAHMPTPHAQRIRDEAFAAMEAPGWLPEHARGVAA